MTQEPVVCAYVRLVIYRNASALRKSLGADEAAPSSDLKIYRPARQKLFTKNDACVAANPLLRERVPQSAFGWQRGARTQVYPQ